MPVDRQSSALAVLDRHHGEVLPACHAIAACPDTGNGSPAFRVDGNLVIDDWIDRGFAQRTVDTATLPAGDHQIVVEFYENGGSARVLATIQQL